MFIKNSPALLQMDREKPHIDTIIIVFLFIGSRKGDTLLGLWPRGYKKVLQFWRWRIIMCPLLRLNFCHWIIVISPLTILCNYSNVKVRLIVLIYGQRALAHFTHYCFSLSMSNHGIHRADNILMCKLSKVIFPHRPHATLITTSWASLHTVTR